MIASTALAVASIAATVIGTGVQMYGMSQQAAAAKAQGAYQQAVGRNNQILAERAATDARARGKIDAENQDIKTRQLEGRQNAVLAANGVVVNQDSALDIKTDTAEQGKLDALTIRSNAEREALGYEAQGMNFQAQGDLAGAAGRNAANAANIGMFGTALTSAGTVASRWYAFNYAGIGGNSGTLPSNIGNSTLGTGIYDGTVGG